MPFGVVFEDMHWSRSILALVVAGVLSFRPDDGIGQVRDARSTDHVLVKLRPVPARAIAVKGGRKPLQRLLKEFKMPAGAGLRENAFARWKAAKRGKAGQQNVLPDFDEFLYFDLPPGMSPEACVQRLRKSKLVEYAEVDPIGWGGALPNDSNYSDQWYVGGNPVVGKHINTRLAWDLATGTSSVIVAVLDSGIESNNAEFAGRVVAGYDFANTDDDPADDHGHGTAVASVLAATGMNTNRGAGVDWKCRIMPVKVLEPDPGDPTKTRGNYAWWALGINWAVTNGAKVINLSAGGWGTDTNNALRNAISNAIAHGCIFVTITHNNPGWGISYPGLLSESITVGGTDEVGSNCSFSASGPEIDLVAPATNIFTVTTGNTWLAWCGTSLSAPQVSGAASLICALRPGLNQYQVKALLCAGADDRDQKSGLADTNDTAGFDNHYGWGRLNVYNSLVLARTEVDGFAATNDGDQVVSWATPLNASSNRPYRVAVAASMTSSWITATGIVYGASRATWRDDGTETGVHPTNVNTRMYKVRLKTY